MHIEQGGKVMEVGGKTEREGMESISSKGKVGQGKRVYEATRVEESGGPGR